MKKVIRLARKLGNFVHPISIIEKYGADALRLYLIGSPAAHADSFKFKDDDISIIEGKIYQLFNGVKFFLEHCICYTEKNSKVLILMDITIVQM